MEIKRKKYYAAVNYISEREIQDKTNKIQENKLNAHTWCLLHRAPNAKGLKYESRKKFTLVYILLVNSL